MSARKKKKIMQPSIAPIAELNVMPFIDIFSLLCTFLLFSAVFVSIGIIEVQVPFLSNAAPSKEDNSTVEKRMIDIKIEIDEEKIVVNTSYTMPPADAQKREFSTNESGLGQFHNLLVKLKEDHPKADKVTLFVDEKVIYNDLVNILDRIKLKELNSKIDSKKFQSLSLFPKVIIGNVIL